MEPPNIGTKTGILHAELTEQYIRFVRSMKGLYDRNNSVEDERRKRGRAF